MARKSRTRLSGEEKNIIKKYAKEHHKATHDAITSHFSELWKKTIARQTVSKILSEEHTENLNSAMKTAHKVQNPELETALVTWINSVAANNGIVADNMILEKASMINQSLEDNDASWKGSNGWLHRFKKRFNLKLRTVSGESGGYDKDVIKEARIRISAELAKYPAEDVYNMDETALLYRNLPQKTISSSGTVNGSKQLKDRVTMLFCCNSDGSDKRKPMLIGKSKNPRCFKQFRHDLYVDYSAPNNCPNDTFLAKNRENVRNQKVSYERTGMKINFNKKTNMNITVTNFIIKL